MALSFLSQNSGLLDLQSIFDPQYSHHQQQQQQQHLSHHPQHHIQQHQQAEQFQQQQHQHQQRTLPTKFDLNLFNEFDQMEFNNNINRNQYQSNNINNNSNTQNTNNTNTNNSVSENLNQIQNRHFISGYHHQHIGSDYEQVINFVDSPPNSEESWTETSSLIEQITIVVDAQSKDSPGPQIIDVQTIYLNSGSRKRRMDWDSLDIGQSENSPTASQSGELPSKVANQEKDKHKREKHSGRSSWSDDIGFDLNAEFNSNSYLNNENFLSFSPTLTTLKQEPQTEHIKPSPKISLENAARSPSVAVAKLDDSQNSPPHANSGQESATGSGSVGNGKHDVNSGLVCGCGSPQGSPLANTEYELNEKGKLQQQQQLSVLDPAKIEIVSANGATHSEDHKFQYILAAATSIATKNNEETLTYLNQGQSYEIKLKKIGDLSLYRDKILKSVIKICFHERRLQFMEREQMQQWQQSRPGERIIEVDVPLSYGLCHVSQPLSSGSLNTVEIFWDPLKEVGVYIKVNCISTEFTPKKHGGEKGVPFRLQIETYIENTNSTNSGGSSGSNNSTGGSNSGSGSAGGNSSGSGNSGSTAPASPERSPMANGGGGGGNNNGKQAVHAAACQIKVFKLKGADRKHKQDREKIQKRPQSEQDKFQPSYECTIMNDISLDLVMPTTTTGCYSPEYMKLWPNSPVHIPKYDGMLPFAPSAASPATSSSPIAINSVTSTNSPTLKLMEATSMVSPQHVPADMDDYSQNIMPESTPSQVTQWLTNHRLTTYLSTFAHFSGADIMRMSKEDLIQICGLADGIRMFNILRAKTIAPRLTLYASLNGCSYNAIYLLSCTAKELQQKLFKMPGFYEFMAKASAQENGAGGSAAAAAAAAALFNNWGMQSKYSGSGSNIFNDANKSCVYISGPSGILVTVTDEVLNNEIKDGSLYALEVQAGKVILKLINKQDNN
ncbi:upstream-binding protein 1 isoform X1 [Drosophila elegans]|uniref:upstream-binding protein 1 isoform X1 n=1 Tax=Drosophila elegans TaxID=30023 RepID=UPI0007E807A5|nr:upstream-binding protein 1 isoform X1 [Drosophila elegans]